MRITSILSTSLLTISSALAQYTPPDGSGLEGLIVERYYQADTNDAADEDGSIGLMEGAITYRIFVDMLPGYELLTVGGYTDHPITFATGTTFFNNDDRGEDFGRDINASYLDNNTVALDSWITIGAASDTHWGVLKIEDADGSIVGGSNNDGGSNAVPGGLLVNTAGGTGIPLTEEDGLLEGIPPQVVSVGELPTILTSGTSSYSSDNFAYAVLGGLAGPTPENKVLIGQFTTEGTFEFCLNLWLRIPADLVCDDPNCHEFLEYYAQLLPTDTAGKAISGDNKFTHPTLCFNSSSSIVDCLGVPNGPATPGSACDDGNEDTSNDTFSSGCECLGEDCEGVAGGTALPGTPCDDSDPLTIDDTWQTGCVCDGTVGIDDRNGLAAQVSIFPNPTSSSVHVLIEGNLEAAVSVTLRNALGQELDNVVPGRVANGWSGSVELTGQASGIYFIEVVSGSLRHTERVTKY
ncbi:MAG: T9SS type A sorting domain-containing protein [Flavobacteriales bacterium]|nr:T9SS type A sorting domain-containing protein [Flavobacteriales bacterium]